MLGLNFELWQKLVCDFRQIVFQITICKNRFLEKEMDTNKFFF